MSKLYTVWCGDVEVNDYYFDNYDDAQYLAQQFIDDGYDDCYVETISEQELA
jgi:hypothetical protein